MMITIPKNYSRRGGIINYLSYPILMLFFSDILSDYRWLKIIVLLISGVILTGSFTCLYVDTNLWNLENVLDNELDEHQIHGRNEGYQHACTGIATMVLLGVINLAIALDPELRYPGSYKKGNAIGWGAILITLTLPSAIIAWNHKEI